MYHFVPISPVKPDRRSIDSISPEDCLALYPPDPCYSEPLPEPPLDGTDPNKAVDKKKSAAGSPSATKAGGKKAATEAPSKTKQAPGAKKATDKKGKKDKGGKGKKEVEKPAETGEDENVYKPTDGVQMYSTVLPEEIIVEMLIERLGVCMKFVLK